ncbi:hypothetical protein M430DRAFT_35545, partial [Amorphotheca resinae ATCC 22711]
MAYSYHQVPFWDFFNPLNHNGAGVDHPAAGFPFSGPFTPAGIPGFGGFADDLFTARHGRRARRGRPSQRRGASRERTPEASRSGSPNPEEPEDEARDPSPRRHNRHGPHHGGRGGWHGHGRGAHRGAHPYGGPGAFDLSALFEALSGHPIAQAFRTFAEQAAQQSGTTAAPTTNDDGNTFMPPVDIFSTDREYVLHVSLPGAKKEDVGVNFDPEKGDLNIAGMVYRPGDEQFLESLTQSERKVGMFERTVKIPPVGEEKVEVDGDAITAKMEDGLLVVTIPKVDKEWTEVKRVDI